MSYILIFNLTMPWLFLANSCSTKQENLFWFVEPVVVISGFFKENVRYPVRTCRDPISLILGTRFSLILCFLSLILETRFSILGTRIGSLKCLEKSLGDIIMTSTLFLIVNIAILHFGDDEKLSATNTRRNVKHKALPRQHDSSWTLKENTYNVGFTT